MAITRKKKEETLKSLSEKIAKADSAVFSNYKGMTVAELEGARKTFRESNIEYQIAKKSLIKIAFKEKYDIELSDECMEGPVGVAFGYEDSVSLCKAMSKIAKKVEEFELLGGVVDGKEVDKNMVQELAKMMSRPELLAKFASMLKSPLHNFGGMLNAGTSGFARALSALAEKKEQEGSN